MKKTVKWVQEVEAEEVEAEVEKEGKKEEEGKKR